jgi:hypothetical protein
MIPIDSTLWKYSCRLGEMHDLMKTMVFLRKLPSPRNREGPWPPWRDAKNHGNIDIYQKWILEYLLPFLVSGLGSPGLPWALLGSPRASLWDSRALPWAPQDSPGKPRGPPGGSIWASLGHSWSPLGSPGLSWVALGSRSGTLLCSPELHWAPLSSPGCPWELVWDPPALPWAPQDAPGRSRTLQDAPGRSKMLQDATGRYRTLQAGVNWAALGSIWGRLS